MTDDVTPAGDSGAAGKAEPKPFDPAILEAAIIAPPLLVRMKAKPTEPIDIIIDADLGYRETRDVAKQKIIDLFTELLGSDAGIKKQRTLRSAQYVYASISADKIRTIALHQTSLPSRAGSASGTRPSERCIHRIWLDHELKSLISRTPATVKVDAARTSFSAMGDGVVWAVIDSGVHAHPHFTLHENLKVTAPVRHMSFVGADEDADPKTSEEAALNDQFGHGTHVAGIICGEIATELDQNGKPKKRIVTMSRRLLESGDVQVDVELLDRIGGMAPKCKIVSMKVLDAEGNGLTSNVLAAIEEIQRVNGYGRELLIHGVNLSVGYDFDPEWFACGQSPLCIEVDRLVRSGVVVVVAAGNTGYGFQSTAFRGAVPAGLSMTINDPGNAELAITVGSTHRDMPHMYGVSYFSSKGPTGDGRRKPDLVAPGERILSCAAGAKLDALTSKLAGADTGGDPGCVYIPDSGTSMAAPHVSGAIAAFLSVRREFVGRPDTVKQVFLDSATDLKREPYFQGHGLVDLMRAIQSV
ncbi:MAG: S8 family peptidase [bacterium]